MGREFTRVNIYLSVDRLSMSDTRTRVMDIAERMARSGGYNGFSFREIAAEIGIKSASVHHHFPTKENLANEVAKRYTRLFLEALGNPFPESASVSNQLRKYCSVFQGSFEATGRTCLCGMFSNEAYMLPDTLRAEISEFASANLKWLCMALAEGDAKRALEPGVVGKAQLIYCSLEGAIGVAALKEDPTWLKSVSEELVRIS